MIVDNCIGCRYCERIVWTQEYKPANYHKIGINHAYYYCRKNNMRCRNVKSCADKESQREYLWRMNEKVCHDCMIREECKTTNIFLVADCDSKQLDDDEDYSDYIMREDWR